MDNNIRQFIIFLVIFLISINNILNPQKKQEFHRIIAKSGDGISILLQRFNLDINEFNINKFKELNSKKILKNNELILGYNYYLPILIIKYNSKSIESSIEGINREIALKILEYNKKLLSKGLISESYKISKKIYVPLDYLNDKKIEKISDTIEKKTAINPFYFEIKGKKGDFKIFGDKYSKVTKKTSVFRGYIFYLVSGHGGPDPGAIGFKDGFELHEDEYAYDVTLRLGRNIIENGGRVYFLIIDKDDGIRDDRYLNTGAKEMFFTGDTISIIQKERLSKGAEIINEYFHKNKKKAKEQISINIHLDSRETKQKIDIFFYHQDNNKKGETIANTLLKTIKHKYDKKQPGRGYTGSVSTRNLYMLKNVIPTTVYIELGNIQNERDQIRFIEFNNRQAIANWLYEGLKKALITKK